MLQKRQISLSRGHLEDKRPLRQGGLVRRLQTKSWKWFFLIVFLFFVGNLFVQVPALVASAQKPFPALEAPFASSQRLDLKSRSSLLLARTDEKGALLELNVVTYDPDGKRITFISIPPQVSLNLPSEKDSLANIYPLSFDKVFWQSANLVGTTLDGYLVFQEGGSVGLDSVLALRKELFSLGFFLDFFKLRGWLNEHLQTNLSVDQLLSASRTLKGTNPENIVFIDLADTAGRDGFDQERMQSKLKSVFIDSEIASEALSVQINNGSGVVGLGSSFKQVVTNLGGRVVAVETGSEEKTRVIVHSQEKGLLTKKIAAFLGTEIELADGQGAGDIVVILGKDLPVRLRLD